MANRYVQYAAAPPLGDADTAAYFDDSGNLNIPGRQISLTQFGLPSYTDDTLMFQRAIDYSARWNTAIFIPPDTNEYRATGLTVSQPCTLYSLDNRATVRQIADSSTPVISVERSGGISYWHNFVTFSQFWIKGLKDDPAGVNTAHGLSLLDSSDGDLVVRLDKMYFSFHAADALAGASFPGWVEASSCVFFDNKRRGVYGNSCFDWRFRGCDIGVAGQDCVELSGSGAFVFLGTNIYSATNFGVDIFADSTSTAIAHAFIGCSIDRNKQHGVRYDVRNSAPHLFQGTRIASNSQQTQNGYSGVFIRTNATNGLSLVDCQVDRTYAVANPNGEKYNVEFEDAGSTIQVNVINATARNRTPVVGSASFSNLNANIRSPDSLLGIYGSTSYADDAAAAAGGVAIGSFYRDGSVIKVRVS